MSDAQADRFVRLKLESFITGRQVGSIAELDVPITGGELMFAWANIVEAILITSASQLETTPTELFDQCMAVYDFAKAIDESL